ncbi:MAG: hypothetical protein CL414_00510 [Acidimicrobiaceae bacterium]|nr:hypothetical protein [Acidimicrobiaceae bacterium]
MSGTLVGLVLVAAVSICGADGLWGEFDLPPVLIAALGAILVQWLAFGFAWKFKSERFFDLFGSGTFVFVVLIAALYSRSHLGLFDVALMVAVSLWALRLGSFLVTRVRMVGFDRRFDAMKQDFSWFLMTWTLQGTWVVVTTAPVVTVIGDGSSQPLGLIEIVGLLIWLGGFSIEIIADDQKKKFRLSGSDTFIQTGLWNRSRHPNYFGEIVLWTGLALAAFPSLDRFQLLTLISPLFVWALLVKISGIPMLEAKAERKWGSERSYVEYKSRTPMLVPRLR